LGDTERCHINASVRDYYAAGLRHVGTIRKGLLKRAGVPFVHDVTGFSPQYGVQRGLWVHASVAAVLSMLPVAKKKIVHYLRLVVADPELADAVVTVRDLLTKMQQHRAFGAVEEMSALLDARCGDNGSTCPIT